MAAAKQSFAERLKAQRELAGFSQYTLSKRSGLSRQSISQLEMGMREPTWETVQRLAKALGLSCESFIDAGIELPDAEPPRPRGRPKQGEGKGKRKKGA